MFGGGKEQHQILITPIGIKVSQIIGMEKKDAWNLDLGVWMLGHGMIIIVIPAVVMA